MASADLRNSPAIPQLLEGVGVNNGRRALEVAKTNATTRNKVIKLLLAIGVPAGLIAGVGSMMALNKSDGSLGNEKTGSDSGALVINEPNATGNVAALVTGINKEVGATITPVSTTTPPTKVGTGVEPLPEGSSENSETVKKLNMKIMQLLEDMYDEEGMQVISQEELNNRKREILKEMSESDEIEYDLTALELMMGANGERKLNKMSERNVAIVKELSRPDDFPRINAATRNLKEGESKNWLRVEQTYFESSTDNPNPRQLYIVALRNDNFNRVLPRGYVRVAMTDDPAVADKWKREFDQIDQNLKTAVTTEPFSVAGVSRNEE